MSRFSQNRRVFYVEEPVRTAARDHMEESVQECGVTVVVPHLHSESEEIIPGRLSRLLDDYFDRKEIESFSLWYYTPMAIPWTAHLKPAATVYDCMDELSGFKNAPSSLKNNEMELFKRADLVFTGGHSLFQAKRRHHPNVYAFPSSIDVSHFAQARSRFADPEDQAGIPRPRLGFCGVIDERMDLDLLAAVADMRSDWQLILVGPVVKIDPAILPKSKNIHYLGMKSYDELPRYMGGWDMGILPFARNASTRFISPTKTPEYLAAGLPVVSTSIADVIRPYGELGLVAIADHPSDFVRAVEQTFTAGAEGRTRVVDDFLSQNSWTETWGRMDELLDDVVDRTKCQNSLAYSATASGRA